VWGRSKDPAEVEFDVFRGFRINTHKFLSTTHYSPAILTTKFNEFALTRGMTVFDQVGLKSQLGAQAMGGGAEPLATPHFD